MRLELYSNHFLTFGGVCMYMHFIALWKRGHDSRGMKVEKEPKASWESNNTVGMGRYSPSYCLAVRVEEETHDSFDDGSYLSWLLYVIRAQLEMVYISDLLESAGTPCSANCACPFPTSGLVVSCGEFKISHDGNIHIMEVSKCSKPSFL